MPKADNLLGQKFGKLTVISKAPNKNGRTCWNCKCDCGKEVAVISKSLKDGNTKSCGCLHREVIHKTLSKDITNIRFGKLVAIEPTGQRQHGSIVWKCKCDCGNTHYASVDLLTSGKTKSCGCLHSIGNSTIKTILEKLNISFSSEYYVNIDNKRYAFDFVIYNSNNSIKCLIEYDGILHFERKDDYHGWNNEQNYFDTQQRDNIKNEWCKINNIPLIRIPYTDFKKINEKYILDLINRKGK